MPSLQLSDRAVCDLELLACGAFSPLDRFMSRGDYERVVHEMRLADGTLYPVPVTLPVDAETLHLDRDVALRSPRNDLLAVLTVEEIYAWDDQEAARALLGTTDLSHPLVLEMRRWGRQHVSGALRVLRLPAHYDFEDLRLTPRQVRDRLERKLRPNVVAFHTRQPLHRVQEELIRQAAEDVDGTLLLHPAVDMSLPGEVDQYTRVRTYRAVVEHYFEPDRVVLAVAPLAPRMAGPREALWHALVRRNYGANHFIVEPEVREFCARYAAELGVTMVAAAHTTGLSERQVREEFLNRGEPLPAWFTRPETAAILSERFPPRHHQGACIWFTGLSGSGKSTTAEVLATLLREEGRQVSLLDGDVVRTHLSKGLSFSKEDRDTNIRRIGFVASEIVRYGGLVVCAAISPYQATRNEVRQMIGSDHFIEVFMDTPLAECERRDVKGLYAKARRGEIAGWTGINDPYEPPEHPEIVLQTVSRSPQANAREIVTYLYQQGFLKRDPA